MVRDKAVHQEVIEKVMGFSLENGFSVKGLTFSPVKGPEGNIEYLIYLQKAERPQLLEGVAGPRETVEASHQELDR